MKNEKKLKLKAIRNIRVDVYSKTAGCAYKIIYERVCMNFEQKLLSTLFQGTYASIGSSLQEKMSQQLKRVL
jgi:hypothetical protein